MPHATRTEADILRSRNESFTSLIANLSQKPVPDERDGGRKTELQPGAISNTLKAFNDRFGNIEWTDQDRIHKIITDELATKVNADTAYQTAIEHSDRAAARMEPDRALKSIIFGMLADHSELYKSYPLAHFRI